MRKSLISFVYSKVYLCDVNKNLSKIEEKRFFKEKKIKRSIIILNTGVIMEDLLTKYAAERSGDFKEMGRKWYL